VKRKEKWAAWWAAGEGRKGKGHDEVQEGEAWSVKMQKKQADESQAEEQQKLKSKGSRC